MTEIEQPKKESFARTLRMRPVEPEPDVAPQKVEGASATQAPSAAPKPERQAPSEPREPAQPKRGRPRAEPGDDELLAGLIGEQPQARVAAMTHLHPAIMGRIKQLIQKAQRQGRHVSVSRMIETLCASALGIDIKSYRVDK